MYSFRVALKNQNFHEMGRHEVILSISGCLRHEKFMPDRFQALPRPKNPLKGPFKTDFDDDDDDGDDHDDDDDDDDHHHHHQGQP